MQSSHIQVHIAFGVPIVWVSFIPILHATLESISPLCTRNNTIPSPCTSCTVEFRITAFVFHSDSGGNPRLPPPTRMPTHWFVCHSLTPSTTTSSKCDFSLLGEIATSPLSLCFIVPPSTSCTARFDRWM